MSGPRQAPLVHIRSRNRVRQSARRESYTQTDALAASRPHGPASSSHSSEFPPFDTTTSPPNAAQRGATMRARRRSRYDRYRHATLFVIAYAPLVLRLVDPTDDEGLFGHAEILQDVCDR